MVPILSNQDVFEPSYNDLKFTSETAITFAPNSSMGFPGGLVVKNLPVSAGDGGDRVRSLGWEDPLEKEMTTHFSNLAWRIPWTEKPGGLQSMGSPRVAHNWATKHLASLASVLEAECCLQFLFSSTESGAWRSTHVLPQPVFLIMKPKHRPRPSSGWQPELPLQGSKYHLLALWSVVFEAYSSSEVYTLSFVSPWQTLCTYSPGICQAPTMRHMLHCAWRHKGE